MASAVGSFPSVQIHPGAFHPQKHLCPPPQALPGLLLSSGLYGGVRSGVSTAPMFDSRKGGWIATSSSKLRGVQRQMSISGSLLLQSSHASLGGRKVNESNLSGGQEGSILLPKQEGGKSTIPQRQAFLTITAGREVLRASSV